MNCISASSRLRCSLCWPRLPCHAYGNVGGSLQRRFLQHFVDAARPAGAPATRGSGRDAARRGLLLGRARDEHLVREAPQRIERRLHSPMTLLRAVAEAHDPAGAEAEVIARLLDRLRRELGELRLARTAAGARTARAATHRSGTGARSSGRSRRSAARPGSGSGSPADRAGTRDRPRCGRAPSSCAGVRQQMARLTEQIERDVGERRDPLRAPAHGRPTRRDAARGSGSCRRAAAQ